MTQWGLAYKFWVTPQTPILGGNIHIFWCTKNHLHLSYEHARNLSYLYFLFKSEVGGMGGGLYLQPICPLVGSYHYHIDKSVNHQWLYLVSRCFVIWYYYAIIQLSFIFRTHYNFKTVAVFKNVPWRPLSNQRWPRAVNIQAVLSYIIYTKDNGFREPTRSCIQELTSA